MTDYRNTVLREVELLHYAFRPTVEAIHAHLVKAHKAGKTEFRFEIYETLRVAPRQNKMIADGVSKAREWQSAHQYGHAVDFVPYKAGHGFFWPEAAHKDWNYLKLSAEQHGALLPISWDKAHVESAFWDKLRTGLKLYGLF